MIELLALILSDFKHFIGTIILIGFVGFLVVFGTAMVIHFIKGKP